MNNNSITIASLKSQYQTYLQPENSSINAFAPNSFWDIDAGAMAAILLDLYMNLQTVQNSIYPQYAVGDQVDQWLYSRGLVARIGATYGIAYCFINSTTPTTIEQGTIFANSSTQFQTLSTVTVPNGSTLVALYTLTAGTGVVLPTGAQLNLTSTTTAQTAVIQNVASGQLEESDQSCITRILQSIRVPQAGARTTDYFQFALQADTQVTFAIILPSFIIVSGVGQLGVFPLIGSSITPYDLDQGLASGVYIPYTRKADITVLDKVRDYINSQRLVGLTVDVFPCETYTISPFEVQISLAIGYELSTLITINTQAIGFEPTTAVFTVEQLVKRQVRSAICNQQFGATNINNTQNYITIDSLLYSLNQDLSALNGSIAQILTNAIFSIGDIAVPNQGAFNNKIQYTYDVAAYSSISVVLA